MKHDVHELVGPAHVSRAIGLGCSRIEVFDVGDDVVELFLEGLVGRTFIRARVATQTFVPPHSSLLHL